jgi:hypothetical protein
VGTRFLVSGGLPPVTKGWSFSLGWEHHPGPKCFANNYWCASIEFRTFCLGWYYQPGQKGRGSNIYFGPRRRKAFSLGSKVEPGLKARTKDSLSTSPSIWVHMWKRTCTHTHTHHVHGKLVIMDQVRIQMRWRWTRTCMHVRMPIAINV